MMEHWGESWGKHKALKGYSFGGEIQHQGYTFYTSSWLLSYWLVVDSYVVLLLNHSTLSDSTFCGFLRCKIRYFTPFHYVCTTS